MKTIVRLLAISSIVFVLAACVAPGAGTSSAESAVATGSGSAPASEVAALATAAPVVTVSSEGEGLRVAMQAIASGKEGECMTLGMDSIMLPSEADLVAVDALAASGATKDAKGRTFGPEATILAAYGGAALAARTEDRSTLFLTTQLDGHRTVVLVRGFKTPRGNTLWLETGRTYSSTCP